MQSIQLIISLISQFQNSITEAILKGISSQLEDLKLNFQPKEPTEYLTRNEVAELLKIDLSSVHNWTKKGILTSYQIGGRVYYKRQELEDAIVKLKN
ncbi:helix-turn-helix domain-containing protein [Tamlana flava]|uniref:helix-turn-helix domain-containing protein n=1 Tax=Tamlana flava TaxID=3158572 RepID=UPI00351B9C64